MHVTEVRMARFSAFIVIATVAAHALALPARAQDAEAIEAGIRAAWAETSSVVAALALDATVIEMPVTGVGEVRVLKQEGKTYYDQDIQLEFPAPMGVDASVHTLYDGTALFVVNTMLGHAEAFQTRPAISTAPPPPDAVMLLDAVKERYTLSAAQGEDVDARETVWLEGQRTAKSERVERIRMGFDKQTGFPLHIELHSPDVPEPVVMRHTALRVSAGLDASDFVFEAPEGVEVQVIDGPPGDAAADEESTDTPAEEEVSEETPVETPDATSEEAAEESTEAAPDAAPEAAPEAASEEAAEAAPEAAPEETSEDASEKTESE
jgi:hypothetical protein